MGMWKFARMPSLCMSSRLVFNCILRQWDSGACDGNEMNHAVCIPQVIKSALGSGLESANKQNE